MVNAWQVKKLQRYDFLVISEKRIENSSSLFVFEFLYPPLVAL